MSGSGKSYFIKEAIKKKKPARLLIFDSNNEFNDLGFEIKAFSNFNDFLTALITNKTGRFSLVAPTKENYQLFCRAAKAWGNADFGELTVIIEEAAVFSNVGKALTGELELITQGRKFEIDIAFIIQSLAEGSKTALKNINSIRIGNSSEQDCKYLEGKFGKDLADAVRGLTGYQFVIFDQTAKEFKKYG